MPEQSSPLRLERLVTTVAVQLMAANAATSVQVSQDALAVLVDYFGVDAGFLRHHDHSIDASTLIAEWPARPPGNTLDPGRVIRLEDADADFANSSHGRKPLVFGALGGHLLERFEHARPSGQPAVGASSTAPTMAAVPLVSGELTTGVIGLVKFGDRPWRDDELNALEAIGSLFAQVQARVAAEDRLRKLAERDDLTGLHNRRSLLAHLENRLAAGQPGPVSVLYFDLDRLKTINDYLGHPAGDKFLCVIAQRLEQHSGRLGLIARLSGDEFVVIPATPLTAAEAEQLAMELLAVLGTQVSLDGELVTRTASVGVAQGMPVEESTSELLRRADLALMRAKSAGGNGAAVFSNDMSMEADYRTEIELHLASVIDNGSLHLRYLPEVDMRTGEVLAAEALVRWDHPTRGPIAPASFIEVAESINLAGELGMWVIRTACRDYAGWRAKGVGLATVLRINVSPAQLVAAGFAESVAATMKEFGLESGSICLEITESVVVQDIETTSITLTELKNAGVLLAIDDFGTGYSVLSHLKSLPVDVLKIDRGFVTDLGTNPDDLAIVRAIVVLAEAFGLQLVAEGVETKVAARTLLRHGCRRAQGVLMSPPLSGPELEALLTAGRISTWFAATPGA